jgi:hypothetical protein
MNVKEFTDLLRSFSDYEITINNTKNIIISFDIKNTTLNISSKESSYIDEPDEDED